MQIEQLQCTVVIGFKVGYPISIGPQTIYQLTLNLPEKVSELPKVMQLVNVKIKTKAEIY